MKANKQAVQPSKAKLVPKGRAGATKSTRVLDARTSDTKAPVRREVSGMIETEVSLIETKEPFLVSEREAEAATEDSSVLQ